MLWLDVGALTDGLLFGALANGGIVRVGHDGEKLTFAFEARAAADPKPSKPKDPRLPPAPSTSTS